MKNSRRRIIILDISKVVVEIFIVVIMNVLFSQKTIGIIVIATGIPYAFYLIIANRKILFKNDKDEKGIQEK